MSRVGRTERGAGSNPSEWHIADLTFRIAQLKDGSGLGSDTLSSAEFIELLQQTLDSWEERKKTLAEHH
ncbi:MAG: hypothetical protein ACXV3D_08270 [Halobacteriota archaeon]